MHIQNVCIQNLKLMRHPARRDQLQSELVLVVLLAFWFGWLVGWLRIVEEDLGGKKAVRRFYMDR